MGPAAVASCGRDSVMTSRDSAVNVLPTGRKARSRGGIDHAQADADRDGACAAPAVGRCRRPRPARDRDDAVPVDPAPVDRFHAGQELRPRHGTPAVHGPRTRLEAPVHALHGTADVRERRGRSREDARRPGRRGRHLRDPSRRALGRRAPGDDGGRPLRLRGREASAVRRRLGRTVPPDLETRGP